MRSAEQLIAGGVVLAGLVTLAAFIGILRRVWLSSASMNRRSLIEAASALWKVEPESTGDSVAIPDDD